MKWGDEITCPFPNFNGATVEVLKWIRNFIPHFTGHGITLYVFSIEKKTIAKALFIYCQPELSCYKDLAVITMFIINKIAFHCKILAPFPAYSANSSSEHYIFPN